MRRLFVSLTMLGGLLLLGWCYRDLVSRPFIADDYQWLVGVRDRSFASLWQVAFDLAQNHFYRPLVWLWLWLQFQWFGLDPWGYHMISLILHSLNGLLLLGVLWTAPHAAQRPAPWLAVVVPLFWMLFHPAPFEAVVWISAQSELLAATWLLVLVVCFQWLRQRSSPPWLVGMLSAFWLLLALLTKESAIIGLPLLLLLLCDADQSPRPWTIWLWQLLPAAVVTALYLWLQLGIEQRNYLLQTGGYAVGWHIVLNPLRMLGLVAAPLPGSQFADRWWLPWVGGLLLLGILTGSLVAAWRQPGWWLRWRMLLPLTILGLTLAPTAPFTSPPDSRYVYLAVLVVAVWLGRIGWWLADRFRGSLAQRIVLTTLIVGLLSAAGWWAFDELRSREARFSAAGGPGGSLWRLATELCQADLPRRVVIVDPPVAHPHVEAIVLLACGDQVQTRIVSPDGVERAMRRNSVLIGFPQGSAVVERRQP